jgi:AraC-like DNA-binding protein/quercetin dioxygenase-like cupin family protein
MIIYKDNTKLDKSFPFSINKFTLKKADTCDDTFHWHDFCEISYIEKGYGSYFVNGKEYNLKKGDLIIFNNVEPHGWRIESDTILITVLEFSTQLVANLNYKYLESFISRGSNFKNKIDGSDKSAKEIYTMIEEIYDESKSNTSACKLLILSDILRILALLIKYYESDDNSDDEPNSLTDKKKNIERLENAFNYINKNFSKKLALKEVAKSVYMSESYFSSYFKKVANISFMDYVTNLRLKKATQLISTTDKAMCEIATESGFNNMANFYRIYKKHIGELPRRT